MEKFDMAKIIGLVGIGLGMLATVISNYAESKHQEKIIEEKIDEALSKREVEGS